MHVYTHQLEQKPEKNLKPTFYEGNRGKSDNYIKTLVETRILS